MHWWVRLARRWGWGMPDRITLRRVKGWRLPPNTRVVTRATVFGNPFTVAEAITIAGCAPNDARLWVVECFGNWLRGDRQHWMGQESDAAAELILARLPELRGMNLACFCKPGEPCHADVLLEIANA